MSSIRPERPPHAGAICRLNVEALGGTAEADLIDCMRPSNSITLSLVAHAGGLVDMTGVAH